MAKIRDVVCNMKVDVAGANYMSEHNGAIYYFCASGCKAAFDGEPEVYVLKTLESLDAAPKICANLGIGGSGSADVTPGIDFEFLPNWETPYES